jgi:ribosomal protein S18 acetylase RimI-like enzyme
MGNCSPTELVTFSNKINVSKIEKLEFENFGTKTIQSFKNNLFDCNSIYYNNKFIGCIYSILYGCQYKFDKYANKLLLDIKEDCIFMIPSFNIKKEYQGKRFGSQLLEYELKMLKTATENLKYKYVCLHVKCNNKIALKLYLKNEFIIFEKMENYYNNREDGYLMYRKLN